ncbi:MAG: ferritin family protein [Desulfomonilaceae bacterium]|nr:ferritin family protein [Desulfomonilaceae bacterium]
MAQGTETSMKMLAAALEKEEQGRDFYAAAVSKCGNDLGKQMFRMLMADEGIHIKRIKDIYAALQGGVGWTDQWKVHKGEVEDLRKLFAERIEKLGPKVTANAGDIEALEIGIEMEQGAIKFYEDHLEKAADPLEREFISAMVGEERGHYTALKDLTHFFKSPDTWFIEKEHHVLDGA